MSFNLEKYQGIFYEVYRQNAYFEYVCDVPPPGFKSNITALYELKNENTLNVTNTCVGKNGELIKVFGFVTDNSKYGNNNLILTLNINGQKIESEYIVFYTDYVNYSIVGNLENQYLSFLSRTDKIDLKIFNLLSTIAKLKGFEIKSQF